MAYTRVWTTLPLPYRSVDTLGGPDRSGSARNSRPARSTSGVSEPGRSLSGTSLASVPYVPAEPYISAEGVSTSKVAETNRPLAFFTAPPPYGDLIAGIPFRTLVTLSQTLGPGPSWRGTSSPMGAAR